MKNITAMEKTTIEKTAMKRITTTALLLFLAFFSLTTKPNVTAKTRLVCGGESLFFHRNRNKNLKNNDNSGGYSWRSNL